MIDYVSKHDLIETISRKLTPKTVGEMLDWADWLWYHFDTYTNALKGAVRYFLGDIDIEARNDSNNGDERRKITTELFRDYDIMDLLGRVGDEFIQWGNCFTSIEPVVRRKLYCPHCHATVDALQVDHLSFKADDNPEHPVFFGDCPVCRQNVGFNHFEVIDSSKPLRVQFWNPRLVGISYCPTTKDSEYYVSPSDIWKEAWSQGDPHFVAETPTVILTAMQRGMRIHMKKDFFFHAKTPSPSTREDLLKGWGMPLFMNCFPKCVQIMLLDKFDESIIADHVVPFPVISPSPQGNSQPSDDPLRTVNMGSFRQQMELMISRHRANPSYIQVAPFAINYQLLGGEAKQLVPVDLRNQKVQDLLQAMNILDFSQMQGQGGPPPNLRFFEKVWGIHINTLNRWGQWLCDARTKIIKSTPVNFSLVKSSIYENDMSLEYKTKLGMGGVISMDTALRPLGIDFELEQTKLRDEQQRADEIAKKDQKDMAKADELEASLYSPQPGTQQLMAAQQGGAAGAPPPAAGGMGAPPPSVPAAPGTQADGINGLWDQASQMAQQLLTMQESERKSQLINLSKTNPMLHSFVSTQLKQLEQQAGQQGKVLARQGQL